MPAPKAGQLSPALRQPLCWRGSALPLPRGDTGGDFRGESRTALSSRTWRQRAERRAGAPWVGTGQGPARWGSILSPRGARRSRSELTEVLGAACSGWWRQLRQFPSFPSVLFRFSFPQLQSSLRGGGNHPPFCWQQWKPPAHGSVAEACPARRAGDLGTVCRRLWGQQRALAPSRPPGPLPAPARSPLALAAAETRVPGREGFPSLSPLPRVTRRPRSAR